MRPLITSNLNTIHATKNAVPIFTIHWLADCLAGWLTCWLAGWMDSWFSDRLGVG